jgi:hypothetical protein
LTFVNADGEVAEVYRKTVSPRTGTPTAEERIDPRIAGALQLIEAGLLMPARLAQMSFGERSQSLYEAVKLLTGLDQLADIAQGVGNQFAHNGRKFLKYAKDHGMDEKRQVFDDNISDASEQTAHVGLNLTSVNSIEAVDLLENLTALITRCESEAAQQLSILKTEIAATLDLDKAVDRETIGSAVAIAKVLLDERTDNIPMFGAWAALTGSLSDVGFQRLPSSILVAERELADALNWHQRQLADRKLRLKALAAQWFNSSAEPVCPLCDGPLQTIEQKALARELEELSQVAEAAEKRLEDVCAGLEKDLRAHLPDDILSRFALLQDIEPCAEYLKAMLERFVDGKPFSNVLEGSAKCLRQVVIAQGELLPKFEFTTAQAQEAAGAGLVASAPVLAKGQPCAVEICRFVSLLRRLVALAEWWKEHRATFAGAFEDLRGRVTNNGEVPAWSVRGQIKRLEEALSRAEPYDAAVKCLNAAKGAAISWREIRVEQKMREEIRDALLPLKDLRLLVDVETARSIQGLSGRIESILERIHLRERLTYRNTGLVKREVEVHGAFNVGMKIDAALVANTSWLRAILWAFILALREETIQTLGGNPLPLLLLDDPQITFDPRNKRKWVEELARMANQSANEATGVQLILTTHEHDFFVWLTELEKVSGHHGFIAPVDDTCPVATIVIGGYLERFWTAAQSANSDAEARRYIAHVRIHAEKLLKLMMRADGADIQKLNFEKLRDELLNLRTNNVAPYNRKAFGELLKCLKSQDRAITFISDVHHSDAETLGIAQSGDVHSFWQNQLEPKLLRALQAGANFAAFSGDGRTFAQEPCVLQWPDRQQAELRKVTLMQTGIAAAAKTGGRIGDGLLMIEEWDAGRLQKVSLPNHELFRLAAGTLEPVAAIGDMLIVSNYAKVHARGLVVAAVEDRFLARRYNEMETHPDIAVLTGQSIDPYSLVEPVIVVRRELQRRKIVGTLFASGVSQFPSAAGPHEFLAVDDVAEYWAQLDGARLFKVQGRSAEPLALDGQYLMTRDALSPEEAVRQFDGRLVVAVDQDGAKYFKRLRRAEDSFVILESLNPDGSTSAELMTLSSDELRLPRLTHVLPVVGVLFELPSDP